MKDVYYFSHDNNARNDEKILCLIAENGLVSYAVYWILLEMMHENTDTSLRHDTINGIASRYNIDITSLQKLIQDAVIYGLFESDNVTFWSNSLRKRKQGWLDKRNQMSDAGKRGMAKRWGSDKVVITKHNKVKESKGK